MSGEELCTEGSSDEEGTHRSKLRKSKKMQEKNTKQTISPLARQSDSTLRPQQHENAGCSVRSSSLEATETEFEVVWRPKRGSLQLPTCSEGTFLDVDLKNYATKL